eukprot:4400819-Ditylum_brightwellii.AAC.1
MEGQLDHCHPHYRLRQMFQVCIMALSTTAVVDPSRHPPQLCLKKWRKHLPQTSLAFTMALITEVLESPRVQACLLLWITT